MKRTALAVAVVVALIVAIVFATRGPRDGTSETLSRETERIAVGTVARAASRDRRAREAAAADTPAARRIEGVVVDAESDEPFAGAEILLARRVTPEAREGFLDVELAGAPELRATTSVDGKFGVDVPQDGPWFVTARAADHVDAVALVRVGDDVRLKLAVGVEKTFTVRRAADRATIAGAEISVYGSELKGPPRLRCMSDQHGEARLRVRRDDEMLVVRAKGYARSDHEARETDLLLVPGYRIAGVVRDRAGHGVPGAVLRIDDARAWTSDADGRFVLEELSAGREGRRHVDVSAASFAPWSGSLSCGDTDAVVELSRIGAVVGTVVLPDGSPAANADVFGASVSEAPLAEASTDATGGFRIAEPSGRARLHASWRPVGGDAADKMFGSADFEVPDGEPVEGVVIRLTPKSFVPVQFVDASGDAVRLLSDVDVRAKGTGMCEIAARGDVEIVCAEEPVGTRLDLEISANGSDILRWGLWGPIHVEARTQQSPDGPPIDVHLPAVREFTATVLASDGSALPAAARPNLELYAESERRMHALARGMIDAKTWIVAPGKRFVLAIGGEGLADVRRALTPQEIEQGSLSVRLVPGVTVRGRVVSSDPSAVSGARFFLAATETDRAGLYAKDIVRDADGSFRIAHVSSGMWRLTIRSWPMTLVVDRQVQVTGDADVDLGDVVLPASAWLHGAVRTPDGRLCSGAVVQLLVNDADDRMTPTVVSQEDGSFDVYAPSVGRRTLLVRRRGFGAAVARLDGVDLASPLVVHVAPEGKLDIRVRLPHPGDHFDWSVQTPDGAVRWQPLDEQMDDALGFDRRFVCSGLGPGPVVVTVESPRSDSSPWKFTANVVVVAGATTPVVVGPER